MASATIIHPTSTIIFHPKRQRSWTNTNRLSKPACDKGLPIPPFPEKQIEPHLDNTWLDTGKSIVNNWLGLVYQLTNIDRKICFIEGVDPHDPLGLKK